MKSFKIRLIPIISLAAAVLICLGSFLGLQIARAERTVTPTGASSSYAFTTNADAEVWSHKKDGQAEYYTMFVLKSDKDSVSYRKNLAYEWFSNENDGEATALKGKQGLFSTVIGFEANENGKLGFERFILTFESQQYTQSKDGKSVNYIIFAPDDNGTALKVLITADKEQEFPEPATTVGLDNIKIEFSAPNDGGEYAVSINDGAATGAFKNVGGTYAKYSSSTTTPVTPISFTAEFPEKEGNTESYAKVVMYNLNGQSFKLKDAPKEVEAGSVKHFASGAITDDTAPVLCLDKGVTFIGVDKEISFNYTVIDVITSSPSIETSYFMLTDTQKTTADFDANIKDEDHKLYTVVKDSDDQKMDPHVKHYIPVGGTDYKESVFDKDMHVTAAVKVLIKLTDTTSTGGMSTYVMLDWYVAEDYKLTIGTADYIAVAEDKEGAYYAYAEKKTSSTAEDPATGTSDISGAWQTLKGKYQEEVEKAAVDLKAGNKNKFYLPSAKTLFGDNATKYEDLTFSIYYETKGGRQQETGKAYNALSIPLNNDGKYVFTVYATDAQGNPMYYFDAKGSEVGDKKEFTSGEVWTMHDDEDLKDYLPWFEFTVQTTEISIEEPKEQTTAYVGSSYAPSSFEINGVSYDTTYSLYVFDNKAYYEKNGEAMTYSEFMEKKEQLINDAVNGRPLFNYIFPSSGLQEGTDVYEKYNEYQWNSSSLSFVPQDANTFYLIKCEVKGKGNTGSQSATAYMGIASAPKIAPLAGEDTWVQDNMVSIILLCIAGASLVGIVLLLVIKPKQKGDLDELETVKPSKKSK